MKRNFPCGQHRRPTVTSAEENKKEIGGECINENSYTLDSLVELTIT